MVRLFRRKNPESTLATTEISKSGLFDKGWYLTRYPDVALSGDDPVRHYLEAGAALGYDPGPGFSTRGYLARYPDVARSGTNPLLHYLRHGKPEGRAVVAPDEEEVAGSRPYRNFAEFLRHSLLQPVIPAPFEEVDRCCFALMDRIAADLAGDAAGAEGPLVSVVMPAFNRAAVIAEAIESVLGQRYPRFELIVVDDGSSDGTGAVAQSYAADPRVRVERQAKNQGVSAARNRGLALARGELIAYLDSDNTWLPDYLGAMVGAFLRLPDIEAAYGGQYFFRPGEPQAVAVRFGACNKSLLRNHNYIDLNCFVHRRSVIEQAGGGFCETLKRLVDWDLILRIAATCRLVSVPVLQSNYFHDRTGNAVTSIEPLEPALETVRARLAALDAAAPRLPLDASAAVLTLNPLDPGSLEALRRQPEADILLLHPDARPEPGAVAGLRAACAAPGVAMAVPRQVLSAGHAEAWRHVPWAFDPFPCDVSLSALHGNVEQVGVFHDGERVELSFAPFFCVYIKREAWDRCGGLLGRSESKGRAERVMCDYIRLVLEMKIIYTPAAVVHQMPMQP